jgi:tetratricopeptide (TPR) repeat protein
MACDRLPFFRACEFALAVGLAVLSFAGALPGQFGPSLNPLQWPQARSQEELDALLEIVTESDLNRTPQKVDLFVADFPKSEFLGVVFQYKMLACERTGHFECLLQSGEKALQFQKDNLNVLLTLASVIPRAGSQQTDAPELLDRAEDYARRALKRLKEIHIAHETSLERWKITRGEMEAQAHQALGQVATRRGDLERAIAEFEIAAFNSPSPQGSQFLLLGTAYAGAGKTIDAVKALRRAAELGPDEVQKLASKELMKLNARDADGGTRDMDRTPPVH